MHGYLAHSDPGIIQDFLLFGQNRSKIMHIFNFKSKTEQKRFSQPDSSPVLICSIGICERKRECWVGGGGGEGRLTIRLKDRLNLLGNHIS